MAADVVYDLVEPPACGVHVCDLLAVLNIVPLGHSNLVARFQPLALKQADTEFGTTFVGHHLLSFGCRALAYICVSLRLIGC
jgi:hypothetical protein